MSLTDRTQGSQPMLCILNSVMCKTEVQWWAIDSSTHTENVHSVRYLNQTPSAAKEAGIRKKHMIPNSYFQRGCHHWRPHSYTSMTLVNSKTRPKARSQWPMALTTQQPEWKSRQFLPSSLPNLTTALEQWAFWLFPLRFAFQFWFCCWSTVSKQYM